MKRILFIIGVILCAGCVLAQDIIVLKSGERIEHTKVQSITDRDITYVQNGNTISVPHNSVEAILYEDGRYEEIKATYVGDSASIAAVEQLGYDAVELQAMINNGEDRKLLLWQDKTYPKDCRKAGKKEYYKVFTELYKPAFKEAKKNGLNGFEAMQEAANEAFPKAVKASNDALRECNGGMYPTGNSEKEFVYEEPVYEQAVEVAVVEKVESTQREEEHVYEAAVYEEPVYEAPAPKKQKTSKSSSRREEPIYEQAVEVAVVEQEEEPIVEESRPIAVRESETIFKVDTKFLSFSAEGGSQQVYVEANSPWEIFSSPDWIEVRRLGGRLTIICAENAQLSDREDDIVLRIKQGQIIRITVTQDKNADFLNLSANMVNENDGDGGRYIIYVRANKPYKAYTMSQWCRVNTSADSLVLSLDENRSGRERQCEVEVMVSEQLKKIIIVKQVPLQHYVLVNPQIVTATKRGGTISIRVDSDEKWRVVNLPGWCQISDQTNDSFLLNISPNDTGVSRTGSFSVSAYGTRKSITVKQE